MTGLEILLPWGCQDHAHPLRVVRFLPGNRELRDGAQRSWAVLGSPWSLTPVAALEWEAFNISSSQIGHLLRIQNSHILDELDPANLWVPNIKPKQLKTFSRHSAAQFHLCVFFWGLCGHFYGGVRLEALCVAWELLGCRPSGVWNSRGNLGMIPGWEGRLTNDVQNMVKSDKKQDAAGLFLMVCDVCGFCTVEVWLSFDASQKKCLSTSVCHLDDLKPCHFGGYPITSLIPGCASK